MDNTVDASMMEAPSNNRSDTILRYIATIPKEVFRKEPSPSVKKEMAQLILTANGDEGEAFHNGTFQRVGFRLLCSMFPEHFDKDKMDEISLQLHNAYQDFIANIQNDTILRYIVTMIPKEVFKKEPSLSDMKNMASFVLDFNEDEGESFHNGTFQRGGFKALCSEFREHFDRSLSKEIALQLHNAYKDFISKNGQPEKTNTSQERQFVGIAYQIPKSKMSHSFDVEYFADAVSHVFTKYYTTPGDYVAPYFVFVQSSGMGKTKILYQYKRLLEGMKHAERKRVALMVLCRSQSTTDPRKGEEAEVFDKFMNLKDIVVWIGESNDTIDFDKTQFKLFQYLDKYVDDVIRESEPVELVLMFDEAHYLLRKLKYTKENEERSMEALLFRLVRVWLRTVRPACSIVATFSGTSAKLKNFRIASDPDPNHETDTRDINHRLLRSRGVGLFPTFFMTTTIGCLRKKGGAIKIDGSEYQQAIPYGRPLFAMMESKNELHEDSLSHILRRMLQLQKATSAWKGNDSALLSILGTRVQMGQMAVEVSSNLIEKGYANLTFADDKTATICFMPDPVCARLAMCMMDEDFKMDGNLEGAEKKWWVSQAKNLYSNGLCTPEKGDFGEVMVALYFLMCADVLRKKDNPACDLRKYTKFSVSLKALLDLLVNGGKTEVNSAGELAGEEPRAVSEAKGDAGRQTETASDMDVSNDDSRDSKKVKVDKQSITFGAIQVCRDYNRVYGQSWEGFKSQDYLKHLYKSGVGFYVFPGCDHIDLVFPLKRSDTDSKDGFYFPLVISIKSRAYFSPAEAEKECLSMEHMAKTSGLDCAICLLVVFGSNVRSTDKEGVKYDASILDSLFRGENAIVSSVLRIPSNDCFGISEAFMEMTLTCAPEIPEVFASHAFIGGREESQKNDHKSFTEQFLRVRKNPDDLVFITTDEMTKQLWRIGSNEGSEPMEVEESIQSPESGVSTAS